MPKRPHLSEKIRQEVMYSSAFSCAICFKKGDHIHHIDKNNANNNLDNLILVCQQHHDEAHTTRELSANLTPTRLKAFRKKWYSDVSQKKVDSSTTNGQLAVNAVWAYINHSRLIQTIPRNLISETNPDLFSRLKSSGVIDDSGIFIKPDNINLSDSYARNKIYDWYNHADSMALHKFYSELVDAYIQKIDIIHLDEQSWNRTFIKQMVSSGSVIFVNKAQYFKKSYEDQTNAEVDVYTFKKKIKITYQINTRDMFGMTAVSSSFAGHRSCASLLQVKSIEDVGKDRVIHCTPFALGIGFN